MSEKKDVEDRLQLGPALDDRHNLFFRQNSKGVECGVARHVRDGECLDDTALLLEGPGPFYKVHEINTKAGRSKPATKDYRDGWDRVFGKPNPQLN